MLWSIIWCSVTNLFCLFPTYLAYKKNMDEWVLYLSTGIVSILYHLHHYNKYIKPACSFMNYGAIQMVDHVLSDMCICWITSCIPNRNLHVKSFFLFLPVDMYVVYIQNGIVRWILYGLWVSASLMYILFNRKMYSHKYTALGILSSAAELFFYKIFPDMYPAYYNWIHGVHHIFGFMGIYFYMRINETPDGNRLLVVNKEDYMFTV